MSKRFSGEQGWSVKGFPMVGSTGGIRSSSSGTHGRMKIGKNGFPHGSHKKTSHTPGFVWEISTEISQVEVEAT